jgi:homoserine kinase type II
MPRARGAAKRAGAVSTTPLACPHLMAVYTSVAFDAAARLLADLGLGRLLRLQGIRSGIENTNYFASTDQGEWVVTLFERLPRRSLPYYLQLMRHLASAGMPVPWPQGTSDAALVHTLAGKPTAVVTRLTGAPLLAPTAHHCAQLGAALGRLHVAAAGFARNQAHKRSLQWCLQTAPQVLPHMTAAASALLRDELEFQQTVARSAAGRALPKGPIHADLFRDNAMFEDTAQGQRLSGILDFYFAGTDKLLFDVAVCLNDWCIDDATCRIEDGRAQALVRAYRQQREFAHGEWRLLPAMLRAAALRFWISRLWDWHLPRDATLLEPKDPGHFERVLRDRIDNPWLPTD